MMALRKGAELNSLWYHDAIGDGAGVGGGELLFIQAAAFPYSCCSLLLPPSEVGKSGKTFDFDAEVVAAVVAEASPSSMMVLVVVEEEVV